MATESPDLRVSLDLLDVAIDHAVEKLSREEVEIAAETSWCDYYKMYVRMKGHNLDELTPEDVRFGLEETLYDNRCHETKHPYFVQAVIRALMEKRRTAGTPFRGADFAREFPAFYGKLRDEQLDLTDEGRLIPFGWRPQARSQPLPQLDWVAKIDDDDVVTGLEFLEELHGALGASSVAELPITGKRSRWRKMWDEDIDRLRRMYETSRERIAKLLLEKGELKELDRLPEKYPESERYRVVALPSRIATLVDVFLEEYERRPGVRIKHVSSVPGWGNEPQRKRRHERHAAVQTTAPAATPAKKPDFDWIDSCEPPIARESRDILADIKLQLDLEKDVLRISPYPHGTDDLLWPGYHEAQAKIRMDVAQMLVKKGILAKAEHERRRGDYGLPSALIVEAERHVAIQAIELLQARIEGRRRLPRAPVPPKTMPPTSHVPVSQKPTSSSPVAELGHEFRKEAVGELGRKTGGLIWWLLGLLLLFVLGLVPVTRNAAVKWARGAIHEVFGTDTTRTK